MTDDRLYAAISELNGKVDNLIVQVAKIGNTQEHQQKEIDTLATDFKELAGKLEPTKAKVFIMWFVFAAGISGGIALLWRMVPIR